MDKTEPASRIRMAISQTRGCMLSVSAPSVRRLECVVEEGLAVGCLDLYSGCIGTQIQNKRLIVGRIEHCVMSSKGDQKSTEGGAIEHIYTSHLRGVK
jgi:hypothetical protein